MWNMLRPTLVGVLVVGIAGCADDPRSATDPPRPSFVARRRAPSVFVVDVSRDTTAQNETPGAANPSNPDNLLTAANDWNYNDGVAYNVSFDGGRTWSATLPDGFIPGLTRYTNDPSTPGTGFYDAAGDPAVAYGPDGTAYLAAQAFNFFTPPYQIALYVTRSTDGGGHWSGNPVQVSTWENKIGKSKGSEGQFPDHESMAVDNNGGSPFYGSVYVTWVQFNGFGTHSPVQVAYSDIDATGRANAYVTWAPAARAADPAAWSTPLVRSGAGDRFGAELSVAPGGRYDLMFDDRSYSGNALVDVTYATSGDGGASWTETRVSTAGFDPARYGVPCGSCATGIRPFIGDYNGIASLSDHAMMTWTGVAPKTGALNTNLEIFFGSGPP